MIDTRQTDQAFAWAETVMGGKVISKVQHERWRPQWFLEFDTGTSTPTKAVMRGFRNPGYASPDETHARSTLKFEAEVLQYLEKQPVRVPKFYGHNEELGWLLMEQVAGNSELTDVSDPNTRYSIFSQYLDDLATLHSQPLDHTHLPGSMDIPRNTAALISRHLDGHEALYRAQGERLQAEPLFEFGLRWLRDNPLTRERPMRFGLGDIGPNQFMFDGSRYTSLLDFEFAFIADPLLEIGLMRCREMAYPIGRFGELIRHYGRSCEKITGEPLDLDALQYWTIYGAVLWPLLFNKALQRPDPALPDQAFLYAFEELYRRCIPEALAERYGIELEAPEMPAAGESILTPHHELLIAQLDGHFTEQAQGAEGRTFVKSSAALARTLARGDRIGLELAEANLDELSSLLGARPKTVPAGLRQLEIMIAEDYKKDFEERIRFFYRFEMRKEYLYEPMFHATDCATFSPLSPLLAQG